MQNNSNYSDFCGSPFWDWDLTWNTNDPLLTPCFHYTLQLFPCAFILLFAPLDCYFSYCNRIKPGRFHIPWNSLNVTKLLILLLLLSRELTMVVYYTYYYVYTPDDQITIHPVQPLESTAKAVAYLLVIYLQNLNRRSGLVTSGCQFFFWLLLAFSETISFYYAIRRGVTEESSQGRGLFFAMHLTYYPLIVVQLLLNCFADIPAEEESSTSSQASKRPPCPRSRASYVSQLYFSWFDGLAWNGFWRPIGFDDIWQLKKDDTPQRINEVFQKFWKQTLERKLPKKILKVHEEEVRDDHFHDTLLESRLISKKKADSVTQETDEEESSPIISIFPAVVKSLWKLYVFSTFLRFVPDVLAFCAPQIIRLVINFVHGDEETWKGYFYAFLLVLNASVQAIMLNQSVNGVMLVSIKIRTLLTTAIYTKSLRLSRASKTTYSVGEILNIVSVDVEKIVDLFPYINTTWLAPIQISVAVFFLYRILGPSIISGCIVIICLVPINSIIVPRVKALVHEQLKLKDLRVRRIAEIMSSMKVLKVQAWEIPFQEQVEAVRKEEVALLKKIALLQATSTFLDVVGPLAVTFCTFATYVLIDERNILDATTAFVSLALFNYLFEPLAWFPTGLSRYFQTAVSFQRINEFMNAEEIDPEAVTHDVKKGESYPVVIERGTFTWNIDNCIPPVLSDINMRVKSGSLVGVVGQFSSGKSSLLQAILGEMNKLQGTVNRVGSLGYVSQQAWIRNATLRDNIIFGNEYNERKFHEVIEACALSQDISILPGGEFTEIGEKGVNISGGQKTRISLCRALYRDADLYLLDDPLSAVDAYVGKHIFERVIGPHGLLKDKTRIMTTNSIGFLQQFDHIIVLKDGRISEQGSFQKLMDKHGPFAEFLSTFGQDGLSTVDEEVLSGLDSKKSSYSTTPNRGPSFNNSRATSPSRVFGTTPSGNSFRSGGMWGNRRNRDTDSRLSTTSSCCDYHFDPQGEIGGGVGMESEDDDVMLGATRATSMPRPIIPNTSRISEESHDISTSSMTATTTSSGTVTATTSKKKGAKLVQAERMETKPVSWSVYWAYLRNAGRKLITGTLTFLVLHQVFAISGNIFLAHWSNQSTANSTIPKSQRNFYLEVYGGFGILQAICIFLGNVSMNYGTLKSAVSFHSKMLTRILRAKMSFFDVTPIGRIVNRFSKDIDTLDNYLPSNVRWFVIPSLRVLAVIVVCTYSAPSFILVLVPILLIFYLIQAFYVRSSRQLKRLESVSRSPIYSQLSETFAGAAIIRAYGYQQRFIDECLNKIEINHAINFAITISNRWLSVRLELISFILVFAAAILAVTSRDTMSGGIAGLSLTYAIQITFSLKVVVRYICDLANNMVAVERVTEYLNVPKEAPWEIEGGARLSSKWPSKGTVEFKSYQTRYREGLDLALRNVTALIKDGEKIGIVGRTGAGKSSLTLALFRIVEATGGSIVIDGKNIANLGLHDIRKRLTIIPQDPVLFSGSLRFNLDPFEEFDDDALWKALELANLKEFVKNLPEGLDHVVSDDGENLSFGCRQLICLARALISPSKILILDEATGNVDLESEEIIRQSIRTQFKSSTVITIAHRLKNILDSDRVAVIDRGEIIEFDSPANLLLNPSSCFSMLVKAEKADLNY